MEFTGTKGEWEVWKGNPKMVLTDKGSYKPNVVMLNSASKEEMVANAKLIAAAPENTKCNLESMELLKSLIANGQINDLKMISVCKLMIKKQEQAIQKALK